MEIEPGSERATLLEFLAYKREALIQSLDGLTDEQARLTPTASALSLLSLVKHSAIWERRWFQVVVAGRMTPGEWPEAARPSTAGGGSAPDDQPPMTGRATWMTLSLASINQPG